MKRKFVKPMLIAACAAMLTPNPVFASQPVTAPVSVAEESDEPLVDGEANPEDLISSGEAAEGESLDEAEDLLDEFGVPTEDGGVRPLGGAEKTAGEENAETLSNDSVDEDDTDVDSALAEDETEATQAETTAARTEEPASGHSDPVDSNVTEDAGDITVLETEGPVDADGNVIITVTTEESLTLPLQLTLKGSGDTLSVTVGRSGQQLKIKPGTYKVTKALDGNNKKLPTGASLTIPEEGGAVHLDFNKPKKENYLFGFAMTNLLFIPLGAIMYLGFMWYIKNFTIR